MESVNLAFVKLHNDTQVVMSAIMSLKFVARFRRRPIAQAIALKMDMLWEQQPIAILCALSIVLMTIASLWLRRQTPSAAPATQDRNAMAKRYAAIYDKQKRDKAINSREQETFFNRIDPMPVNKQFQHQQQHANRHQNKREFMSQHG